MEKNINATLRDFGFGFKKRLGQNFITDGALLSEIVRGAGIGPDDAVVEIGCGAGTLTRELANKARRVVAFEVDRELKPVLAVSLAGLDNTEVIFKDFLKVDLPRLESSLGRYSVVANLPYYATTPLITKIIEESKLCESMTVMVQEEVALRLCASPGTPDYGAITANIALRASAKILMRVGREKFTPSPNVDSAVVKLTIQDGRVPVQDEEHYKKVVRAAFLSRRKTLENNLISVFGLDRGQCAKLLSECGIDEKARGETLSPEDFAALSAAIIDMHGKAAIQ